MGLIDPILRLFGTNRVRLRWKWQNAREAMKRRARATENRARGLAYQHQACPSCGHPAAKDEKTCPKCGARLYGAVGHKVSRALGWLVPEGLPLFTVLTLVVLVALYVLSVKMSQDFAGVLGEAAGRSFAPSARVLRPYANWFDPFGIRMRWGLVTAIFLHFNVLHIVMNGLALWVAGRVVEELFGRARAIVLYVVTGVAGNLLSLGWHSLRGIPFIGVGASGAVFGLIGAVIGHALRHRGRSAAELRAQFVPWAIYGLLMGFAMPAIDNAAHIGGLLSGGILGALLADARMARRAPAWLWNGLAAATVLLVGTAFFMAGR